MSSSDEESFNFDLDREDFDQDAEDLDSEFYGIWKSLCPGSQFPGDEAVKALISSLSKESSKKKTKNIEEDRSFMGKMEGVLPEFATKGWSYGGWEMASGEDFEKHPLPLEAKQRILKRYQVFQDLPKIRTEGTEESERPLKDEAEFLRRIMCVVYAAAASVREGRLESSIWAIRHTELLLLDRIHDVNQLRKRIYTEPVIGASAAKKLAPTSRDKKRPLIDDEEREKMVSWAKSNKQLKPKSSPKKKAKFNGSQGKVFRPPTQKASRQERSSFSTKPPQSFQTKSRGERTVTAGRR